MGLMQGHFTVFKAPTGIGKTELMRYLEWNFIQRGVTFATMHLEETKLRSVLGLVSYDLGDNLTRKDLVEEKARTDDVRASIKRLADTGLYYQFFMKDGQGEEELISNIRMFKEAYGCNFVMFEPIQDVITVSSEENKESKLAELAVRLSKVAADLNVGIVTIAHTNEDNEIKYCKMIGQRASVICRLDRDKEAEDSVDRNTTRLVIEKNRPTSEEGAAGEMFFDVSTFKMEPMP
jgi:replicative DNA helicase